MSHSNMPVLRAGSMVPTMGTPRSLGQRRTALLSRIHTARRETAETGRLVAADLQATERTGRSIYSGLKILRASVLTGGMIWSLRSAASRSRLGRGSRYLTIALTLFSTLRTLRSLGLFLTPYAVSFARQEPHHEYRSN